MNVLDAMRERVLVADGAMGTELLSRGVPAGRCLEELNLSAPALVEQIHREYRVAGAEILTANTFGASAARLARHGLEDSCAAINAAGVRLARAAAGSEGLVAGSVGPLGHATAAPAREIFRLQIEALAEAGADFILLETFRDLDEIREALLAARQACRLPVIAQVSPDVSGNLKGGIGPPEFVPRLEEWGADAIGCNCGCGPAAMLETIRRMSRIARAPLTAQPSAGLPRQRDGLPEYPCSPEEMAQFAAELVHNGVRLLGGCCGTTPDHIRALRARMDSLLPRSGDRMAARRAKEPSTGPRR